MVSIAVVLAGYQLPQKQTNKQQQKQGNRLNKKRKFHSQHISCITTEIN